MSTTRKTSIQDMIEPTIQSMGLELWGFDLMQAGTHTTLRIYLDKEGDEGVTLDACAAASREISAILDVEDPIKTHYQLEVSSPGIERPLYTLAQYSRYVGHEVKVKLRVVQGGRRQFIARIEKVENEQVFLTVDEQMLAVSLGDIQKANLVVKVKP